MPERTIVSPHTRHRAPRIASTLAAVFWLAVPIAAVGAPAPRSGQATEPPSVVQTTFKSVDATVAGQWDFPPQRPAPLVVLIPAAGRLDRNGWAPGMGEDPSNGIYAQLAKRLVDSGFAVFRYDKPGAGRSSPGAFATERANALEAYTHAVGHAQVDPERVFLIGHGLGTDTIAGIYPRFAAVRPPAGVVLLDNTVGESDSLRVEAPTLIVNAGKDPDDRFQYGEFCVEARRNAGRNLTTDLEILRDAERGLLAAKPKDGDPVFTLHPGATEAVVLWLMKHRGG